MSQSGMVATVPHIRQMARCMIVYVAMKEEYMLPRCIVLIEEKPVRAHTLVPILMAARLLNTGMHANA